MQRMKLYSSLVYNLGLELPSGYLRILGRKNQILITNADYMIDITEQQWREIQAMCPDLVSKGVLWVEKTIQSANDHARDSDAEFNESNSRPLSESELDSIIKKVSQDET